MEEAALWTCDLSITVPDREFPDAANLRAAKELPSSLSWPRDQDTEDGTALFLLQALLTRSWKVGAAPLSRLPMDSSVVLRAARCTPGTGVPGAGRPASFQRVRKPKSLRTATASERGYDVTQTLCLGAEGRLSTLHAESRRRSEPPSHLKGAFEHCACAERLLLAAAAIACAEEERRALAQKIEVASAALGSMVGG